MALTTTPELLRELATLYKRIAELEEQGGLRPGQGAPPESRRDVEELAAGLHGVVAAFSEDIVGVLTPAGDILAINASVERIAGWRPDELIGKNAWSFVNQEDLASLASARSAPLDDAIPIEIRVRCSDGQEKWLELAARPWPADAPRYIVARWRDARGRRAAAGSSGEKMLAAEARRAAALARVSQLALGLPQVQDLFDVAASLAPAALELTSGAFVDSADGGLRVRAEAGFAEGTRGQPVSAVMTLAGLARAGGVPVQSGDVTRDGRLADPLLTAAGATCALAVPVRGKERAHGVLLVAGRRPRHFEPEEVHFLETVANVVANAVDARAAQEALRGRERLSRAVFDHARDGLAIVDEDGRCVDVNAAVERLLGTSFEGLRGRRPSEAIRTDLDLSARGGPRLGVEGTVVTPSGTRTVEWDLVPGILPGVSLAVLRDVTERREVQTRLALADRLISVGTLAAGVAHELNTPLAYVTSNLEFLAGTIPGIVGGESGEVQAALRESLEGTERLRLILEDLRTFVRTPGADAGPADLETVLRSCIGMTWNEIRHRARLERELSPLPPVAGNPARLAQVFVNLLVNAAQSIREGDAQKNVIKVAARQLPDGKVVVVEVSDTGAGIPPAVLPRIFEPFFTTKPATGGTGLGLSICRSIVNGLGGTIDVKSQPGMGTTFRVTLSAAERARIAAPLAAAAPPRVVPRSRILVVDDERLVGLSLKRALSVEHDVTAVASPRMALRLVEQGERFDVVLSDLVMPDLTGLELEREIVKRAPALEGRVIFMTAGAFTDEAKRAVDVATGPCLTKPVKLETLRRALADLLAPR